VDASRFKWNQLDKRRLIHYLRQFDPRKLAITIAELEKKF
jgi:hypothetical protein